MIRFLENINLTFRFFGSKRLKQTNQYCFFAIKAPKNPSEKIITKLLKWEIYNEGYNKASTYS